LNVTPRAEEGPLLDDQGRDGGSHATLRPASNGPVPVLDMSVFDPFFRNHPLPMWVCEPGTSLILDVNDAACESYGYTIDEFLAGSASDLDAGKGHVTIEDAGSGGRLTIGDASERGASTERRRHRRRDGSTFDVRIQRREVSFGDRTAELVVVSDVSEMTNAARELRESIARKDAVFASALDGIVAIDESGTIIEMNPAAEQMFGYDEGGAIGHPLVEIIPPDLREQHRAGFERHLATGETSILDTRLEIRALRRNGEGFPVELSITRSGQPGSSVFTGFIRDIADRRRAERDTQRLAAIVESSDDAIIRKSLEGTIEAWNGGAERIYGYTAEEAVGCSIRILVPPGREDEVDLILAKAREGNGMEHFRTQRMRKDGRIIDVSVTVSPIRDGTGAIVGSSTIARDITEMLRAEGERAERERVDRASQAKSEFLARMSHELRTPLNAVLGFAQLLKMEDLSLDQLEWAEQIERAGKHLLNMIDEVLDIAKIESRQMTVSLEPVLVDEIISEVLELIRPAADEAGIELVRPPVGEDLFVTADRQRIRQILLNLLSNAVKFNAEGGSVRIDVEQRPETVRVSVTDTGIGIGNEHLSKLFTPFERLGADEHGIDGTGLGLALSKGLVDAMGGSIGATSEPGRGSTFWVDLMVAEHLAAPTTEDVPPEVPEGRATRARRVLYIEDNLPNLRLIQAIFARRPSITLLSAMQGSLGLDLARQHSPDLVLLDVHLPDMTGEEALRRLRADPDISSIPVVVVTADAHRSTSERLMNEGADAFLTKPIDVAKLIEVVDELIEAE
jgi:PAS domain S-box-containing protein